MKILIKEPYKEIYEQEITNDIFSAIQEINTIIGGYMQINIINNKYIILNNEEAEHINKPICAYDKYFGILYGTLVFAQYDLLDKAKIFGIEDIEELNKIISKNMEFV